MKSSYRLLFEYLFCLWLQYWFWDFMACITNTLTETDGIRYLPIPTISYYFFRLYSSSYIIFIIFLLLSYLLLKIFPFLFISLLSVSNSCFRCDTLSLYLSPSSDMINNWLSAMKLKLLSPVPPVLDVLYVRIK